MAEENPQRDELIGRTEEAERESGGGEDLKTANLFDLRRIIGGLFSVYGIVLIIIGLSDSDAEIAKSAGVHINLWAGLGMLAMGILFLIWAFARPLSRQLEEAEAASDQPSGGAGGDGDGPRRNGGARPEQA